jgi:hypothetical protein
LTHNGAVHACFEPTEILWHVEGIEVVQRDYERYGECCSLNRNRIAGVNNIGMNLPSQAGQACVEPSIARQQIPRNVDDMEVQLLATKAIIAHQVLLPRRNGKMHAGDFFSIQKACRKVQSMPLHAGKSRR